MTRATLTPALVRATVRAGQVYRSGPRRYVRVLRVTVDPPHVLVAGCTRAGARVRGPRRVPWTVYLTWRHAGLDEDAQGGGWQMPTGYEAVRL